jgi:anti-anti-sigma factor
MAEFRFFIHGDLDAAVASRLHSDLDAAIADHPGTLVIDCSELTFIDAAGINVLIAAHRKLHCEGRGFKIQNLQPLYHRIFEMLALVDESWASSHHLHCGGTIPSQGRPDGTHDRRRLTTSQFRA